MKEPSKFSFKNITLSIETSKETVTCSLPASKVSVILDQIQENLRQSFIEIDDENQTILSRIKTLDQNDYPIHLYLDFPINASQANYFIKNIRDKAEQEKYREIQEEIEILLTKASISSEKQLELLANIISNLDKPILHYEAKDNNVSVRK